MIQPAGDVSLAVVGDVHTALERDNHKPAFQEVKRYLDKMDIVAGNKEGSMDYKIPGEWWRSESAFKGDGVAGAEALRYAGFDVLSLANNHQVAVEPRPEVTEVARSIELLDDQDIKHAGAGSDLSEAMEPAVLKREGLDVGFISVDATPLKGTHIGRASQNSPGIYKLEVSPHFENSTIARADMEMFTETIRSAAEVVDFLILSAHWGRSPNSDICTHQRELGRIAVDHGADLVFGHHPHTPQPPEVYEGAPILYGLGGFAFDLYLPGFSQYGCVAECGIDSEGADISELALRPVGFGDEFGTQGFGWNTVVEAHILTAEDPEGEAALQELMTLCEREGTDYHRDGDRILLRQAEGTAS